MRDSNIDVKELRKIQVDILDEIDSICRKNNIKYSLDGGTLLGAVRHKGYIPWDDDIDIIMNRENYEKFVALAPTALRDDYSLIHFTTNKDYPLTFAKVANNKTILKEDNFINLKYDQGVYVDIFVADRAPEDAEKLKKYLMQLKKSNLLKYSYNLKIVNKSSRFSIKVVRFFAMFINKMMGFYRLNKIEDTLWKQFYGCADATKTFGSNVYAPHTIGAKNQIDYSIFDEYVDLEFEGKFYKCVKDYDKYLTVLYGDYMQLPPLEKRISNHEYIFFSKK